MAIQLLLRNICLIFVTLLLHDVQCKKAGVDGECGVWDKVAEDMMKEDNLKVYCARNGECTGVECFGNYTYGSQWIQTALFNVSMCFGLKLNSCHKPLSLLTHVDIIQPVQTHFNRTYTKNTTEKVPGAHFEEMGMSFDPFLFVTMMPMPDGKHALLGMVLKIRVGNAYPDSLKATIMQETEVYIPQCIDDGFGMAAPLRPTCTMDRIQRPTSSPSQTTEATAIGWKGKKCEKDTMYECDNNQICKDGFCTCGDRYKYNLATQQCKAVNSTVIIIDPEETASTGVSQTVIIVASVSGIVVFFIAAVLMGLIIRFYQNKRRYTRQTQMLLQRNNDDDENELLDGDEPMLQG